MRLARELGLSINLSLHSTGDPMFRRTKVCTGVLIAVGGTLAIGAAPVFGQQQLERVEITGSAIRRIDAESALPVQVIR
jgi:iron complex outermembrane recepter protein